MFNDLELAITDFHKYDKRKFWHVVRHFVKNNDSSTTIPPLCSTSPSGGNKFHLLTRKMPNALIILPPSLMFL